MFKKLITIIFLTSFFIIATYANAKSNPLPLGTVKINSIVYQVEVADNDATRMQGLSGRSALGKNKGMYFVFPYAKTLSFWMRDMQFPLDIVWIKDQVVIGISRNIPPPAPGTLLQDLAHYISPQPADRVLELNANAASTIQIGDTVVFSSK
ncbi:MAG TPA: DUF192 domain-containing protein [Gammaproteobacteria bacterium]|nr:DUF192 domain-containing protein [Gammaproteobacteria bacterium]